MISLTNKDYEAIDNLTKKPLNVHNVNLSTGSYYVKFCNEEEALKELIGKRIFDIVGIHCPKYYYLKDKKCVISEDLNKLKNIKFMYELKFLKSVTLDTVIQRVTEHINNKEEIIFELNIMHFIDILFSNTDRHTRNYGFTLDEFNNAKLVVLDNGMFLEHLDFVTKPVSSRITNLKNPKRSECELFLENVDSESKKYMIEIFDKLTPEKVEFIINSIDREYSFDFNLKQKLIENYKKNYKNLCFIIYKQRHLLRKTR